jgi:cellulose 1,4-beta-cellobiosidase
MVRRTRLPAAALAVAVVITGLTSCRPKPPGGTTTTTQAAPTTVTPPGPTTTGTTPSTPTTARSTTTTTPGGPPGTRVDNPFAGAKLYVNADWSAKASAGGGGKIANQSTALWLDRIAAINGTPGAKGLRAHLDAAVAQGAGLISIVIYDLPTRDCAALASNGELKINENGLNRYKTEYIDPITTILADAKYRNLRVAAIIEPDSLPNLVTNTSSGKTPANATPACDLAQSSGAYVQGVQYALGKLYSAGNVYSYIDAAHSGWLGWPDNLSATASLLASTVKGAPGGANTVAGFITNTANYTPTKEPFIANNGSVNGQEIRQSKFYDWNPWVDETGFAGAMRDSLISNGLPSTIGMLIDTSRNGWGGAGRPAAASTSTDLNTFVNESKIDKRVHRGNWCNQSGAGIGERPRANPGPGLDAYVWVKPPGESDGSSTAIANDEGKGFDRMCDPTFGGNALNGNNPTGAKAGSPIAGQWFQAQFAELVQNASPAL